MLIAFSTLLMSITCPPLPQKDLNMPHVNQWASPKDFFVVAAAPVNEPKPTQNLEFLVLKIKEIILKLFGNEP